MSTNGMDAGNSPDSFSRSTTFPNELYRFLQSGDIGTTDFVVAVTLEKFAFGDRRECSPSIATLCRMTGLAERTVQASLKKLQSKGVIRREMGAGRGNATKYILSGSKFGDSGPVGEQEKGAADSTFSESKGAADGTFSDGKGAESGAKRCKITQEKVQPAAPESSKEETKETLCAFDDQIALEVKSAEWPFNPGMYPVESAAARRVAAFFDGTVGTPHTSDSYSVATISEAIVKEVAGGKRLVDVEREFKHAASVYAEETKSDEPRFRVGSKKFYGTGKYKALLTRRLPEEIEAAQTEATRRQQAAFAADERNRASSETIKAARLALGVLPNG